MKSYTDIKQSKVLSKILPLESADMYWDYDVQKHEYYPMIMDDQFDDTCIRAWSLAALLHILDFPSLTQNKEDEWEVCVFDHDNDNYIEKTASNPVDACVSMILDLHKNNML